SGRGCDPPSPGELDVREAWQFAADPLLIVAIDLGVNHHLAVGSTGEGLAPRVDDHRVAEVHDPAWAVTALIRSEEEDLALDCPRAEQDLPVRGAGREGERRRNGDDLRTRERERSIELGKAQIITDAHPYHAQLRWCRDHGITGCARV